MIDCSTLPFQPKSSSFSLIWSRLAKPQQFEIFLKKICITFFFITQSFDRRPMLNAALKVSLLIFIEVQYIFFTGGKLSLLQYGKAYMEAFLKSGMPVLDLLLRPRKV